MTEKQLPLRIFNFLEIKMLGLPYEFKNKNRNGQGKQKKLSEF